jgi:ribonuclease HI
MAITTPAQLLLAIAEREPLEATCAALGLERAQAQALLLGAAKALSAQSAEAPAHRPAAAPARRASAAHEHPAAPAHRVATPSPAGAAARPLHGTSEGGEPLPHKVCVYSDGASRGNPGPAGAGAVITDAKGHVLRRLGRFLGSQTNNIAEYQGVLLGLSHALAGGAREVVLRADSELAIRQLQGRYQVKNPGLKPLFAEVQAMLRQFEAVTLEHVRREQNKDADEMSNRAIDERM